RGPLTGWRDRHATRLPVPRAVRTAGAGGVWRPGQGGERPSAGRGSPWRRVRPAGPAHPVAAVARRGSRRLLATTRMATGLEIRPGVAQLHDPDVTRRSAGLRAHRALRDRR